MPKSRLLIFLFVLCCLSVLFLPVFTFTYLYPSIDAMLIDNAEGQAERIANHFNMYFETPRDTFRQENVPDTLKEEIFELYENFSLEKVKLFSSNGEILFSTDAEDIGKLNTKDYFRTIVLQGHSFTKLVRKDALTAEGRKTAVDLIETYVPIMGRDSVIGAFEIYYDITELKKAFDALVRRTNIIVTSVSFLLFFSLVISLVKLGRIMAARERAEKMLSRNQEELETLVRQRTTQLTQANVNLQEDIHKREEAEKALQISEEKFRSLVEMASDAIVIADADTGVISYINKKGTELVGREADDMLGRHLSILHPSDEDELYARLIENHYSLQLPFNKILYVQHISGQKIPVEISAVTFELSSGRIVQGLFRDISQRLQFEDELQKSEKLKTASILAGGIAHDFNNLLTAMLGNICLAKMEAADSEKVKIRLEETEKAVDKAKDLTHQLLTFAKGSAPVKKVMKLGRLIQDSAQFVLHGSKVKCDCALPRDLWQAEVDEGQISQVINNLVINAAQAMQEGGTCTIKAENVTLNSASRLTLPAGRYVKISVADRGPGIPPETARKIFDPFFTTKRKGSGLGLSSCYTIIKNHGGQISVDSEVGKGTVFTFYLPASDLKVEETDTVDEVNLEGKGRILVMDDEEIVREAVTSLLHYLGYDVETAKDGQEAINMYELSMNIGHPYDAVIMDLTVPGGMGGKEAVKKIKELDEAVPVIVSSGYYTDPVMAHFKKYGFSGVVPKPYQVEELGRVVKEVLTGAA